MTALKFSGPAPTPPQVSFFPHLTHIVVVDRCYYYLDFLDRFWTYLNTLTLHEQRHYLARAEVRYEKWIFNFTEGITTPPIDIAFMWHIHMLSPFRYYEDMLLRFNRRTVFDERFPLGALRMTRDGPSADDLARWENVFGDDEPYTLTAANMYDGTYKKPCYRCNDSIKLPWTLYVAHRYGITDTPFPHGCGPAEGINFLDIARMKLESDLARTYPNGPTVAGTLLDPHGIEKETVNKMVSKIKPIKTIVPQNEMDTAYERQIQELLKFLGPTYQHDANELLYAIRTSYQGNPSPFSVDLIHGVARHRRFYEAIMDIDWNGYEGIVSSIRRYHDFLAEMCRRPELKAIPTVEIDVSFHVHMLCAKSYREFMLKYFKKVINHDDNIPAVETVHHVKKWEQRRFGLRYGYRETQCTRDYVEGTLYVTPEDFKPEYHPGIVRVRKGDGSSNVIRTLNFKLAHPTQMTTIEVSVHSLDVDRSLSAYHSLSNLGDLQNFIAKGAKNNGYGYIGSINYVTGGNRTLVYQEDGKKKETTWIKTLFTSRLKDDAVPLGNIYNVSNSIGFMRIESPKLASADQNQQETDEPLPSYNYGADDERPPGYAFDSRPIGAARTRSHGRRLYLRHRGEIFGSGLDYRLDFPSYADGSIPAYSICAFGG